MVYLLQLYQDRSRLLRHVYYSSLSGYFLGHLLGHPLGHPLGHFLGYFIKAQNCYLCNRA